jgi:DNA-binding transcriptional ArsR family regulator
LISVKSEEPRTVQPAKPDLILHPIRMRIILALSQGRPLTAQELAAVLLDVPQATLYRHLSRLHKAGVLSVVEERQVRGAVERIYALRNEAVDLSQDVVNASREDNMRYFTLFVASLLGEFARYLQRDQIDFAADGVGYRQVVLYLNDDEFLQLATALNAAIRPMFSHGPAPGRRRRLFTTIVMPASGEPAAAPQVSNEPA